MITDYVGWLRDEGKPSADDAESRAKALILPDLGSIPLTELTTQDLRRWRNKLARLPARVRSSKLRETVNTRPPPKTDEEKRRRKSTANRTLTILKAALNHAMSEDRAHDDKSWRRFKPFKDIDAARLRFLTLAEARRLINASGQGFERLIRGALLTGARYGELRLAEIRHFNPDSWTLLVAKGKSGKPRQIIFTEEGGQYFRQITAGRQPGARLFLRDDGTAWSRSHPQRPMVVACKQAKIDPPVTFHELRHTYASLSLMAGMSMKVLADNLGHADTRMVEKHYGHLADEYRIKMVRETAPTYGLNKKAKVAPLG